MIYDCIIAGGGPAGLSAAVYAARAKLNAVVLERNTIKGGQILRTEQIENYLGFPGILGYEIAEKFLEHSEKFGAAFETGKICEVYNEKGIINVVTRKKEYLAKSLIIATGATFRLLNVEGEGRFSGKGVSYCATC
ncbi:MAG: NAD(P)/FAD-dependent oxidoreductase, partial [Bacillota bacterium]|nr:NAD(P)/FAD-dependent oxidoreductase [Bacillota bacterium]